MANTAHKRDPIQREKDLPRIADLYCRGKTQAEIAEILGLSRQQIGYDLRDIQNRWEQAAVAKIDKRKARERGRLEHLLSVAWQAWERSCQDAEGTHVKTVKGRAAANGTLLPDLTTLEKTTKGQAGDPRFLERVHACITKLCELEGLDAPKKTAFTTPDGEDEWKPTSEEQNAILSAINARFNLANSTSHGGNNGHVESDRPPLV